MSGCAWQLGVEGRSAEGPEDGGRKPLESLRGGWELPASSLASCVPGISGHNRDLTAQWGHQALPRGRLTFTSPGPLGTSSLRLGLLP